MNEAATPLHAWTDFYVITGSSAAALTGLMFVVVTLVAGDRSRSTRLGFSTFSTPTVVHFSTAFFIAAGASAPWKSLGLPSIILELAGLFGFFYVLYNLYRTAKQTVYTPAWDDWLWFTILPFIAYVSLAVDGFCLTRAPETALFAIAGSVLLLILIGIHNAWDVVTFIAVYQQADQDDSNEDEKTKASGASA